jgi:hypothetical protein
LFDAESTPFVFRDEPAVFEGFRAYIAGQFGTVPSGVRIVGSASTGFALSPDKFPKVFHDLSDIDVAVVSQVVFDQAWDCLANWAHRGRYGYFNSRQWLWARQREVFLGWMSPSHHDLEGLMFRRQLGAIRQLRTQWFEVFRSLGEIFPGSALSLREVNGRLYRTEEHLIMYHAESLRRLRRALVAREES